MLGATHTGAGDLDEASIFRCSVAAFGAMCGGPSVAQYGVSHTLARPKTLIWSENQILAATQLPPCRMPCPTPTLSHALPGHSATRHVPRRPAHSALDPPHEPRHPPRPAPTLPHALPDSHPVARPTGTLRHSARAPPHLKSGHHVASPPPAILRCFWPPAWPPRRLPLAAWPTAACPPLTAALAVAT
jgi:hypothetical protein